MNIAMWCVAGGVLGWVGYTFLSVNEARGALVSVIIGAIGGVFGGKVLAPVFGATLVPNEFSQLSMVVAVAMAAALLAIGNLVSNKYNV